MFYPQGEGILLDGFVMSKVSHCIACVMLTTTAELTKKGVEGVWRHVKDKAGVKPYTC